MINQKPDSIEDFAKIRILVRKDHERYRHPSFGLVLFVGPQRTTLMLLHLCPVSTLTRKPLQEDQGAAAARSNLAAQVKINLDMAMLESSTRIQSSLEWDRYMKAPKTDDVARDRKRVKCPRSIDEGLFILGECNGVGTALETNVILSCLLKRPFVHGFRIPDVSSSSTQRCQNWQALLIRADPSWNRLAGTKASSPFIRLISECTSWQCIALTARSCAVFKLPSPRHKDKSKKLKALQDAPAKSSKCASFQLKAASTDKTNSYKPKDPSKSASICSIHLGRKQQRMPSS